MVIGVPKEVVPGERRVALVPELVPKLKQAGLEVVVQVGAGTAAGFADAAMGFVRMNKIQIITGSLDGTSGFLLSLLMCRAMNRSAMNVLFGAFGKIEKETEGPAPTLGRRVSRRLPSGRADKVSSLECGGF
jgi:NAD/NADP transhydrogenase beta subunit